MGLFWILLFWVTKKKVQMQTGSRESFSKEGENFHVHFVANYSLCSTRSSVCSQSFPLHMSSYCFWMAENCCVSRRNILYNVGNGLLVIVVQCYPPSFLSSLNFFDKSLSCSLSAFQKCNNQSVLSANNYLPSKKNGCTCMYFYSDVINCAHSPWKMM